MDYPYLTQILHFADYLYLITFRELILSAGLIKQHSFSRSFLEAVHTTVARSTD